MNARRQLLTLVLAGMVPSWGVAAEKLVISSIQDSIFPEITVPILKEAYGQLGIPIEVELMQAKEALKASNSGRTDGEAHRIAGIEKNFMNLVPVPTPITELRAYAYFKKGRALNIHTWEDLRDLRVAVPKGVRFAENGTQGFQKVLLGENHAVIFQWLEEGRVDVAVQAQINGLNMLKKLGYKDIQEVAIAGEVYQMHHYLNKKNAALVPKLDAVFQQMQQAGKFELARQRVIDQLKN